MRQTVATDRQSIRVNKLAALREWKKTIIAYAFISPWLIGFIVFIIGPMLASLYFSFTQYDMLSNPKWIGLDNYIEMFTSDKRFLTALKVTLLFVLVSVPLKLLFALLVAMIFNVDRKGVTVYRTLYYIPSILGGSVAVAVMWKQLFGSKGAVNSLLGLIGIKGMSWIASPDFALWTLILLVVWQFGSPMLIFLAGLKQIPTELYEADQNGWGRSSHALFPCYAAYADAYHIFQSGDADDRRLYDLHAKLPDYKWRPDGLYVILRGVFVRNGIYAFPYGLCIGDGLGPAADRGSVHSIDFQIFVLMGSL